MRWHPVLGMISDVNKEHMEDLTLVAAVKVNNFLSWALDRILASDVRSAHLLL